MSAHDRGVVVSASRFDAVVFDMDGVVTDTAAVHEAAWKEMFDAFLAGRPGVPTVGRRPFEPLDYLRHVDGKHRDDGVASFLASRGIELPRGTVDDPPSRETVWGLANRKNARFQLALARDGVRSFESSVRLVRELQARRVGTAVVSASRNCRQVLEAAGIGALFPVVVDGTEAARLGLPGKPDPAVFVEAAHRLGAGPGRAVVVEDAIAGVEAGRAGGFGLVVGVDRSGQAEALRAAGADVVVADLAEVSVAA